MKSQVELQRELDRMKREESDRRYDEERRREHEWAKQRQERKQQEQEREERRQATMPSNRLYNGDVSDFEDAMVCLAASCNREIVHDPQDEHERHCNQVMTAYIGKAEKCKADYRAAMQEMVAALAAKWRESGDEDLSRIADALENGNYSPLAI